jgi:undecaprenyl-diphosphatase
MTLFQLAMLAIIQGITEFLPISSSAHLILFPALTGAADQGLTIDAAVHVGTLAAVMLYFRAESGMLIRGSLRIAVGDWRDSDARLTALMALATVPVVALGVVLALTGAEAALRSVEVIAWTTIVFAVTLWLADRYGPHVRRFGDWGLSPAAVMGLTQAIALIPGVSRSGITMTTARALGFERVDAARLSLMMSIPATAAVGAWTFVKLLRSGDTTVGLDAAIAAALSFVAALATLVVLMRMLRRFSMTPFVLYRLALGAGLLWIAYA